MDELLARAVGCRSAWDSFAEELEMTSDQRSRFSRWVLAKTHGHVEKLLTDDLDTLFDEWVEASEK